ncbi:MAG TPA: cyclic nucleotide-binding domain-containing protein [Gemmatimonadales bacterium]|nr:cyclic nucleotide-binding domain-containing protein [Gemmatimonadales bacterium]
MAIDQRKLQALLGRAVADIGANLHAALVVTGDKLGLFRALHELGPTTPADLAKQTGTHEQYVREWLSAIAAGGYITYEGTSQAFSLSEEQAVALFDADLPGAFLLAQGHREVGVPDHRDLPDGTGDFFGEMSLCDGEPRSATIVATTDRRLLISQSCHVACDVSSRRYTRYSMVRIRPDAGRRNGPMLPSWSVVKQIYTVVPSAPTPSRK